MTGVTLKTYAAPGRQLPNPTSVNYYRPLQGLCFVLKTLRL